MIPRDKSKIQGMICIYFKFRSVLCLPFLSVAISLSITRLLFNFVYHILLVLVTHDDFYLLCNCYLNSLGLRADLKGPSSCLEFQVVLGVDCSWLYSPTPGRISTRLHKDTSPLSGESVNVSPGMSASVLPWEMHDWDTKEHALEVLCPWTQLQGALATSLRVCTLEGWETAECC